MAYDDILIQLGEFGRYQKKIYILLCLPVISVALHKLAGVFLQAKVAHRCRLPNEFHDTSFNLSDFNLTMVLPKDEVTGNPSTCRILDTNFSSEYFASGVPANQSVSCNDWIFDPENVRWSTVTEWNLVCSRAWMAATSDSLLMVGILIGSYVFGDLADRYGRRPIFFISLVMLVAFGVLAGFAPDIWTFSALRLLIGAATTGVFLVAYVLALEMVGPSKRMVAGVCNQLFFTAGFLFTAVFAYYFPNWRHLEIAISLPTILFLSYWWFIPESTRWLLLQGRKEEAKAIILKVAKENKVSLSPETLDDFLKKDDLPDDTKEQKRPSALDLMRHANLRKKSLIIFYLWFVNSGAYYGLSWNTSSLGGNPYLNFILSGLVEIPAYCFLLVTLNRWGRRTILSGCMIAGGLALIATMFPQEGSSSAWLIFFAMSGKLALAASYSTVYVFSAEQFPTVVRNVGMGVSSTVARFGSIAAPYINILGEVWRPLPFIIFGSFALSAGALALLLPETHNKDLPDSIADGENFGKKSKKLSMELKENGES
ncbi:unnamed protein product [Bemisia tabaci]|uniref:Major facilitator superfamily (MFS) profile domain-containing protein n=1 Tax=Bemisia tabaci TaxID=7038 RepID=A0A9P0A2V5_BEMTA|nr:PREDICTED: organic cation transporter protein-like [Bemisia tabaci]CAH0383129.1 unnamed protein product [Bemisia tabaci]